MKRSGSLRTLLPLIGLGLFPHTALFAASDSPAWLEAASSSLADANLQGEGHLLYRHNILDAPDTQVDDPDLHDDHSELIHRLYLNHFQGPLSVGLQLDAGLVTPRDRIYLDPERVDGLASWQLIHVTRLQLRYESDHLVLEGGDFYGVMGQGGTLQLSRAPAIDLDVALRGGRFTWRMDHLEFSGFMGKVNPQQLTLVQQNIDPARVFLPYSEPDDPSLIRKAPDDVIWGAQFLAYGGPLSGGVGSTGISYDPTLVYGAEAVPERVRDVVTYSAWLQGFLPIGLDLYGEANAFSYQVEEDVFNNFFDLPEPVDKDGILGDHRGFLAYFSANYGVGDWTFLWEGKRSKDNQHLNIRAGGLRGYAFATPPSLEYERAVVEDVGFTLISNDLTINHWRVDRQLGQRTQLRFDFRHITDHSPGFFSGVPERILHLMGGVDYITPSGAHLTLIVGRRRGMDCDGVDYDLLEGKSAPCTFEEADLGNQFGAYFAQGLPRHNDILWHTDGEVALPIGLDFAWSLLHFSQLAESAHWFYQWQSAVSYHGQDKWGASLYFDLSNNGQFLDQRVDEAGNLLNDQIWVGQFWTQTEVTVGATLPSKVHGAVELNYRPASAHQLKLFYGSIMGGIRCAGGQCRPLPAFAGLRAEYQYRF